MTSKTIYSGRTIAISSSQQDQVVTDMMHKLLETPITMS